MRTDTEEKTTNPTREAVTRALWGMAVCERSRLRGEVAQTAERAPAVGRRCRANAGKSAACAEGSDAGREPREGARAGELVGIPCPVMSGSIGLGIQELQHGKVEDFRELRCEINAYPSAAFHAGNDRLFGAHHLGERLLGESFGDTGGTDVWSHEGDYADMDYSSQAYAPASMEARDMQGENRRMTTAKSALGRAISAIRGERELNQEQLAERARITQPQLSKIERGKQETTADVMAAIAGALDVKVSEIWVRAESLSDDKVAPKRLTREGSSEPASAALKDYREPNNIKALQWALGALVAHLAASRPSEAPQLVAALERIPAAYQSTGPGAVLLNCLDGIRHRIPPAEPATPAGARRPAKPRGR